MSTTNENSGSSADETAIPAPPVPTRDPVEHFTRIAAIVVGFIFVWYILADRHAPWTDQARVEAYVVPIVPQVSGIVTEVDVTDDHPVKTGETLLKIQPEDYELAVSRAESELELAGQDTGAATAQVSTAQAALVEAQANLSHIEVQAARIFQVEKKGVVSHSDGDRTRAQVKQAQAQVAQAKSELAKARQQLGNQGTSNPRIRRAMAELKQARLDLKRTTLLAPSVGGITNLIVDVGAYATAGAPLMTFISSEDVWIQANLRENSISNIKVGAPVDIALDIAPGRIFPGKVLSLGFAVHSGSNNAPGTVEIIQGTSGWLRDSQRFPVNIGFTDDSAHGLRRLGGQADIQFYGSNPVLNGLGWVWIRILSWLSYIY